MILNRYSEFMVKMVNWINFNGKEKPDGFDISDARWRAIVKHVEREFLIGYIKTGD